MARRSDRLPLQARRLQAGVLRAIKQDPDPLHRGDFGIICGSAIKQCQHFRPVCRGTLSDQHWLVGILRHKIYDHLRRTCRDRAVRAEVPVADDEMAWEDAVVWLHEIAAESQSPSRRIELAEFRENLERALGQLPPRVAQVFQLYQVEERSNAEVCERMNISESNLWVMLHRARQQLREHLGGWWHDERVGRCADSTHL